MVLVVQHLGSVSLVSGRRVLRRDRRSSVVCPAWWMMQVWICMRLLWLYKFSLVAAISQARARVEITRLVRSLQSVKGNRAILANCL